MTIARRAAAALPVASLTSSDLSKVVNSPGPTSGTSPSDFPNTQFQLELLFDFVSFTLPGLTGARLGGWVLVPDPAHREGKLTLPRVLLIITQDSGANTAFDVKLGSFGAETLDDTDPTISQLVAMNLPYALAPGSQFGFGDSRV